MDDARDHEGELAALEVRLSEEAAERNLAREAKRRAEEEARRLKQELALVRLDLSALRERLNERETYVKNLHASTGWKALQAVRALFGRRW